MTGVQTCALPISLEGGRTRREILVNWVPMDQNLSASAAPLKRLKEAFPLADEDTLSWAWEVANRPTYGTINCLALNEKGEMSGVTTTSGLAWKIPGRVGD